MKLLALDTASTCQSAAVLDEGRIVAVEGIAQGRAGSERVLSLVSHVLDLAGLRPQELDALAVSRGPGSLTGLRVGIGTARGIAVGANLPLLGVSSLQALARGLGAGPPVLSLIDAGRQEVYGNLYRPGDPPAALGEERVAGPECFAKAVEGREVRIAGSAASRYRDLFPRAGWLPAAGEEFLAAGVARVAESEWRQTAISDSDAGAGRSQDLRDLTPRYLRRTGEPVRFEDPG
ncbi:MAG: tRNA (adenosine(37)-N6)-threonylcarbamoyltransferase complex dimerization subunit type 1 TsaB [Acidobacteria bacterium]|nr:MAG: tRNA (adenosine(37)-N6)-threonylcarbamoyltransferase complex dimerization subunit type 1 TsaB [Acidobacteriota bacterium]